MTNKSKPAKTEVPVFCSHTKIEDIDKLIPNPKNPNTHPEEQIILLAKIIKAQGWRNPIVVSKRSGFIVKGHARLKAAQLNNFKFVPIDEQPYENEAIEWADMIADNKIAELSEIPDGSIAKAIAGIEEIDPQFNLDLLGVPNIDELREIKIEGCAEVSLDELPVITSKCPKCGHEW